MPIITQCTFNSVTEIFKTEPIFTIGSVSFSTTSMSMID